MKLSINAIFVVALSLFAVGCSRTASESEINADGTWKRTLRLSVSKGMDDKPLKIENVFKPPVGANWKVSQKTEKDTLTLTATGDFKVGAPAFTDISIKDKQGTKLVNSVQVHEIAPGRIEYIETFTWTGKADNTSGEATASLGGEIRKYVPTSVDPETVKKMSNEVTRGVWRAMFGPGDPLLLHVMSNPEYATKKLTQRLGPIMEQTFVKYTDDLMTAEQRTAAIKGMMKSMNQGDLLKTPNKENPPSEDGGGDLVPMYVNVKVPGKIVETDGEVDVINGEVFWALFPEAAQFGPVTVRVVCDVNP